MPDEETIVGERPDLETAEDIFLRDRRLLLEPGQVVVEPALFYSRSDDRVTNLDLSDLLGVGENVTLEGFVVEQDTLTTILNARYGLLEETELFGGALFQLQRNSFDIFGFRDSETDGDVSGLFLGARRTVIRERLGTPDVVVTVEGQLPISNGSYAVGGGVSLVKSFDPVVLFGGLEYRHTFARDFDRVTLLESRDRIGATLGYAFAVNDELALSTAVSGLFSRRTEFDAVQLRGREEFSLRLGLTRRAGEGRYIEPSVTFGLSGGRSFVTFGLSLPYLVNP